MELDTQQARAIIEALSQGTPPSTGLEFFTAGLDRYLSILEAEYLSSFIKEGGKTFKVVVAGYGEGKTHLLYSVRRLAWKHGYVCCYVTLSPEETPFHNLELVYRSIVKRVTLPYNFEKLVPEELGFEGLLKTWYSVKESEFKEKKLDGKDLDEALDHYSQTIPSFENTNFTKAIRGAFNCIHAGDDEGFETILQWLKCEGFDRKTHQKYGILQKIDKTQALPLMRSLARWVRWAGYSGLVILFDETEQMPSFSTKQKELLLSNLRQLMDESTNESSEGIMIFYSLPEERLLESKGVIYEALRQRIANVFDFYNPTGVKIYLEKIYPQQQELLEQIGLKVSNVYQKAFNLTIDLKRTTEAGRNIAAAVIELRLVGAYLRTFVQKLVVALNKLASDPSAKIDQKEAKRIVSG